MSEQESNEQWQTVYGGASFQSTKLSSFDEMRSAVDVMERLYDGREFTGAYWVIINDSLGIVATIQIAEKMP